MFSFIVITTDRINPEIIQSIRDNAEGEIIVVGGPPQGDIHIPFNEGEKKSWITRKKNLGVAAANFDNIVIMHDYVKILPGWTEGWKKFGFEWDVASNVVLNQDGGRWRDWCYWDSPNLPGKHTIAEPWCPTGLEFDGRAQLAPYEEKETGRHYVNGTYWVAKKKFMLNSPLNEKLGWGQGEDVEWSLQWRAWAYYRFNPYCSVQLTKHKPLGISE